ncbi:MAG: PEP-CTERM sorting domain-containing protein [Pseudomonadota bacterium]
MKLLMLPALLAGLLLQIAPATAATSASASIDWDSLNIQLIDLSGGLDAPTLTWTSFYGQTNTYAYTAHPYDYQYTWAERYDLSTALSSSTVTALGQSAATQDALAHTASSASQEGTVPASWGYGYSNYAYGGTYTTGYFTLTGNGVALFTMDWSVEGQGDVNDWNEYSYAYANLYGSFSDNLYNYGYANSGYGSYTGYAGDFAAEGTFAMAVVNTSPDGTTGSLQTYTYAYSQSPNAPVPEPETYALMLAGLGLVGVMVRRRKA